MADAVQAEVQELLKNLEGQILNIVHGAWDDWRATGLNVLFPRSRAVLVHDFMIRRATKSWSSVGDIHFVERDETVKFLIAQRLLLRFKKANGNGLGSNISTQATLAFTDPQMSLPGIPDVQKVEVLYELNDLQTKIERVVVAARNGDRKLWDYEIEDHRGMAEVVPLPMKAPTPSSLPGIVRLRKKDQDIKSMPDNSDNIE